MKISLQVTLANGDTFTSEYDTLSLSVGRAPESDLRLGSGSQQMVSWEHLCIEEDDFGKIHLKDLGSTNGSFLNGTRITQLAPLQLDDKVSLGQTGPWLRILTLTAANADVYTSTQPERIQSGLLEPETPTTNLLPEREPPILAPKTPTPTKHWEFDWKPKYHAIKCWFSTTYKRVISLELWDWLSTVRKQILVGSLLVGIIFLLFVLGGSYFGPGAELTQAQRAEEILIRNCHSCHGKDGSNQGGFNFVLNRDKLIDNGLVLPGDADNSDLYYRMAENEMPPPGQTPRPSAAEIEIVKTWIENGARPFQETSTTAFISNQTVLETIRDDLLAQDDRSRKFLRYFTLTHLANADASNDELQTYRNALSKLVNSLSWKQKITVPKAVDATGTILRIDMRHYDWPETVWLSVEEANPYGVRYSAEAASACYEMSETNSPYVRADWFVFAASRPPLYHSVLQLPLTDSALEKELHVDATRNILEETVQRTAFVNSGVSQHNRMIERHDSPHGAYWKSYDFGSSNGRQNLFEFPLGPDSTVINRWQSRTFKHDGGEIIFNLPNGLQGYLLVDDNGRRIDKGPTFIVSDPKQKDRAVVNGISCMSCHYEGIIRKDDEVRDVVLANQQSFPEREIILAIYPEKEEMRNSISTDRDRFKTAVEATGSVISEKGEPVVNMALRFEEELSLKQAAAEAGLKESELRSLISEDIDLGRRIGTLLLSGGTVKRDVYNLTFPSVILAGELGQPLRR